MTSLNQNFSRKIKNSSSSQEKLLEILANLMSVWQLLTKK